MSINPEMQRIVDDMRATMALIDNALDEYKHQATNAAEAETEYRKRWAESMLRAKAAEGRVTNAEAEARADIETATERLSAKLAEALAESSKQALYSYRAKLSALQSAAASIREEAQFARTSPF